MECLCLQSCEPAPQSNDTQTETQMSSDLTEESVSCPVTDRNDARLPKNALKTQAHEPKHTGRHLHLYISQVLVKTEGGEDFLEFRSRW